MPPKTNTKKRASTSNETASRAPKKRNSGLIAPGTSKISLNSLPSAVIKMILCNVDSQFLFRFKFVCKKWYNVIKELLDIKKLPVNTWAVEYIFDEFNRVSERRPAFHSFNVYRSEYKLKNIMNDNVISNLLCAKGELDELTPTAIPERLERCVGDVNYLSDPSEYRDFDDDRDEVMETAWKAVKCFYGLSHPIEELKRHGMDSSFTKSIVSKYECYYFESDNLKTDNCMIALYPDRQTLAVLIFPYTNMW